MRKLAAILASLAIFGTQTVQAEGFLGLGQMTFDGSLEVLGNNANNETDADGTTNDHRGNTITRTRVGVNLPELADGLSGRIELVRNSAGGAAVQYGSGQPTSIATEEGLITIQNAYINLHDFLSLDKFRLGRQYGGRKGDLLMYYGPNRDDSLTVTAFDSVMVGKKFGKVDALFSTGKAFEDDAVANTDVDDTLNEVNVTYVILSSDELISGHRIPLELGYYSVNAANTPLTSDNVNLIVYDLRAGYALMDDKLNVGLEYAMNAGQANAAPPASALKFKGTALVLKGEYEDKDAGWTAGAFYATASGDEQPNTNNNDKAFHNGDFLLPAGYPSISDFRYGEILSNSNTFAATTGLGAGLDTGLNGRGLNVIGLGAGYTPDNLWDGKLTFKLDFYKAQFSESATAADDGIGTEIDLAVKYRHSETVTAAIGYARLSPDNGLVAPGAPSDAVTKAWAKLKVRWGGEREDDMKYASKPAKKAAPARKR